jgi:glycosyltransferase involved in cell wall biosynthesis
MLVENLSLPSFDRRVWLECQTLRRAGCEIVAICPRGESRDVSEFDLVDDIAIHRYSLRAGDGSPLSYVREYAAALWNTWRLARRAARAGAFDVVHAANPPDILLLAALQLRRRGAALVFDHHDLVPELYALRFGGPHGLLYRMAVFFERLSFRLADVVISTNESYRAIAVERGRKSPDDVFVVRNDPDARRRQPTDANPALKRGRKHLIVYVGLMAPQDGVDHALRALALLKEHRDDWYAVFVGDGDVLADLRQLAHELDLEDDLEFKGWLEPDSVIRILSSADICLAPEPKNALNDASTMIKVVEYMALGRPIVCYDLTESRFSAGDAALYATPNDVESFACCIGELLSDPERRATLGKAGRDRTSELLSWERSEEQLLAAYGRITDRARRPAPVRDGMLGRLMPLSRRGEK